MNTVKRDGVVMHDPKHDLEAVLGTFRAHAASPTCMGGHSRDWHGCPDPRAHTPHGEPRHTDACARPCEACHLTPEQREAGAWQQHVR